MGSRGLRLGVTAVLAGAGLALAAASADAAVYEGRVPDAPGSTFEITVEREDGKKTVTEAAWTDAPTTCSGMPETTDGSSGFTSGGRVRRNGSFEASLAAGFVQNRVSGVLKPHGKAVGTFRHSIEGMGTDCNTGRLGWLARR